MEFSRAASDPARAAFVRPPAPPPQERPLSAFATLRLLRRNPIETWTRAHFEQPILIGRTILGPIAVVSDPAAIRRVLVDNAANYRKDALQKRLLGESLCDGLLEVEGEAWRAQRRALAPLFTPRAVAAFAGVMAEAAAALVARWRRLPEGRRFDVQPEIAGATLDILGRTLFSDGLGRDASAFTRPLTDFFRSVGTFDPFDLLDLPDWAPRLGRRRSGKALVFFEEAVDALIARRRRLVARNPAGAPRDLLGLLLLARDPETGQGLTPAEVRANIATFIGAGHETTANAVIWSLYLLSLAPDWRRRLAAEADAALSGPADSCAARLVETRAVIEEAMRLYPPVASMSREAVEFDTLAGRRVRRGTLVVVSQWVLHRHRLLWDEPDLFDPRRFLPGAREKIDRFAYLPLGAGPRVCVGGAFALQEAAILLAHIVRDFALETPRGHAPKPVQRVTLRPDGGLPMILRRR
ncbi:cytochrome P450 [Methylocella sp.]|uniref:cytochrome P450 n=1 Tax=Methylocella sp. TaxID=1978226 RepID=UPI0037833AF0